MVLPLVDAAAALLDRPVRLVAPLSGGTHAETVAVTDGERELVARRFPDGDPAAAREVVVLAHLEQHGDLEGVGVPRLVAASTDLVVTTRVPGGAPSPTLPLDVVADEMARALALVHARDGRGLRAWDGAPLPTAGRVLLHGDFWCGNALWAGAALTGVVDWSGAALGPRELDVAWCRQDLVLLGSPAAGERFVRAYERASGVPLPALGQWDVHAAAQAEPVVETWAPNYAGIGRPEIDAAVLRQRLDAWIADLGVAGTWQG